MIKIQEAEHQIITDYQVFEKRPVDADLLVPAIEVHQQLLGRVPQMVAADAAFFSADNQKKPKSQEWKNWPYPTKEHRARPSGNTNASAGSEEHNAGGRDAKEASES